MIGFVLAVSCTSDLKVLAHHIDSTPTRIIKKGMKCRLYYFDIKLKKFKCDSLTFNRKIEMSFLTIHFTSRDIKSTFHCITWSRVSVEPIWCTESFKPILTIAEKCAHKSRHTKCGGHARRISWSCKWCRGCC